MPRPKLDKTLWAIVPRAEITLKEWIDILEARRERLAAQFDDIQLEKLGDVRDVVYGEHLYKVSLRQARGAGDTAFRVDVRGFFEPLSETKHSVEELQSREPRSGKIWLWMLDRKCQWGLVEVCYTVTEAELARPRSPLDGNNRRQTVTAINLQEIGLDRLLGWSDASETQQIWRAERFWVALSKITMDHLERRRKLFEKAKRVQQDTELEDTMLKARLGRRYEPTPVILGMG